MVTFLVLRLKRGPASLTMSLWDPLDHATSHGTAPYGGSNPVAAVKMPTGWVVESESRREETSLEAQVLEKDHSYGPLRSTHPLIGCRLDIGWSREISGF